MSAVVAIMCSTRRPVAEYVKDRLAEQADVIVAPSVGYGYYPPFVEYPGSTTLPLSVARDMVANICRSHARSSRARRFYIVAHGPIARPVYELAAKQLELEGILLPFTDWDGAKAAVAKTVTQQEWDRTQTNSRRRCCSTLHQQRST